MADHPPPSEPPLLPPPLRAALGLVAVVADAVKDGRGVPDKVLELPVLAVSTALQFSLRAQQQYAALMVRGDELLAVLRGGASDEPPAWAHFDDEAPSNGASAPSAQAGERPPVTQASGKPSAKKTAATKAAAATKPAARKVPAPRKAPATKPAPRKVPAPRNGSPSAFDLIGDS